MNKVSSFLLKSLGVVIAIFLLFYFVVGPIIKTITKKQSPEKNVTYTQGDLQLDVFYCSPSKKGREIFGELVPYNQVWRTGANEASTFTTNMDILVNNELLPAGKYTLWTIPNEKQWQIIFNKKMYNWGVTFFEQEASRQEKHDALVVTAEVSKSINSLENFTISFMEVGEDSFFMLLAWDKTTVPVVISKKE